MLKRVMHVDDDQDIREIAKISLEALGGFEVLTCAGGAEAIARAVEFDPDIIILDVMMPELDGEETFRRLRLLAGLRDVPIVFMTARASVSDNERLSALGADGVLVKPFDPIGFPAEITRIWYAHRNGVSAFRAVNE